MQIVLTKKCYDNILDKLNVLKNIEQPKMSKHIDECRTIGSLDDNPEYYQSLEDMDRLNKKIDELVSVLNSCKIFTPDMIIDDTVMFGTTVKFINCETNEEKQYTLVSIYDSDVSSGFISINSPFAKEMIGLHTGDIFTFNDIDYEITNICSFFQE